MPTQKLGPFLLNNYFKKKNIWQNRTISKDKFHVNQNDVQETSFFKRRDTYGTRL